VVTADRPDAVVDVAVVGAGIAGLTAAHALTAAGLGVTVFEARDRVGGRLLSSTHDGGAVDPGATWFWPDEPLVRTLTEDLGLAMFPQDISGDVLFEVDSRGAQRLAGNPLDVPSARLADAAQALALALARVPRLPPGRGKGCVAVGECRSGAR
jgi:monoamine oxidase